MGLDRFLRVYRTGEKAPAHKMYLKSRLNCVLVSAGFDPTLTEAERAARAAKSEDSDLEILPDEEEVEEVVAEGPPLRKRKK